MRPILVLHATREGHTRKLAEHLAATLRARGCEVEVVDAAHVRHSSSLGRYAAAILAASVHAGAHEGEMVSFVKRHRYGLLKRLVMKRISRAAGGSTDTSRDYEFTDWEALERFAEELVDAIEPGEGAFESLSMVP